MKHIQRFVLIGFLAINWILVSGCATQNQKPNIAFILVDDMGWANIGCYGSEMQTPTTWNFSLTTNGSDVFYDPTTPVLDADYLVYDYEFVVTKVELKGALTLGLWFDVTDVVGRGLDRSGTETDGLPAEVSNQHYDAGLGYGTISLDLYVYCDINGYGHAQITNIGLPAGISKLRATGYITATGTQYPGVTDLWYRATEQDYINTYGPWGTAATDFYYEATDINPTDSQNWGMEAWDK